MSRDVRYKECTVALREAARRRIDTGRDLRTPAKKSSLTGDLQPRERVKWWRGVERRIEIKSRGERLRLALTVRLSLQSLHRVERRATKLLL